MYEQRRALASDSSEQFGTPKRLRMVWFESGSNSEMEIQEREGRVVFAVRVAPRSSRDAVEGEYNGALKVRLTAPPVDDRANDALRRLLAARLNVPLSAVRIVSGEKSRTKRVEIAGVTRAQVLALLD